MQDLTSYSPIRVALTGIWRIILGALLAVPAGFIVYMGPHGEAGATRAPGDLGPVWFFFVGLVLSFVALSFVLGGVGRMVSAFPRGYYFRAGVEGMAIRLPRQGWFGRFRIMEYQYRWEEIEQLIHFTRSVNMIPVARELHIRLYGGKEILIERFYFSASIKRLREELLRIKAQAGK